MSPDLKAERSLFLEAAKTINPVSRCHVLRLTAEPSRDGSADREEAAFLVGQTCGARQARILAEELGRQLGMPAVPWAAVAAPLPSSPGPPPSLVPQNFFFFCYP